MRTPGYGQLVLSGWWWTINYNQACFKFRITDSNVQVFKGCKLRTYILYGVEKAMQHLRLLRFLSGLEEL